MPAPFEVIVVGLGAMGSAAVCHLARRGFQVLGIDQFAPPHALGSSHGQTRIIREAYFEHPTYVPMLKRAYELWRDLEHESRTSLFRPTGGLMIGRPDSVVVSGALRSAREHGLTHELLSATQVRERFPALRPEPDMMGVFEPRAGILFPERCIAAHLELARHAGAVLRLNEPVTRWESDGDVVRIVTPCGAHRARQLIVTAAAWMARLFPGFALPFRVERQVLYWFEPGSNPGCFRPDRCPVHLWQFDGCHFFYGFPDLGEGVKVARHHDGDDADPDKVDRHVSSVEIDDMREIVRRFLPGADGPHRQSTVCLYTNTPDEHFWIDRLPAHPNVIIASPCSGHGFKFSSVIGEIMADLVTRDGSRFDLQLFRARSSH